MTLDVRSAGGGGIQPGKAGKLGGALSPQASPATDSLSPAGPVGDSVVPATQDEAMPLTTATIAGDEAAAMAHHPPSPVTVNRLTGMADGLAAAGPIPAETKALRTGVGDVLRLAAPLQGQYPELASALAGLETLANRPPAQLRLSRQADRTEVFDQAQTALIAIRAALDATPPPTQATANKLQALALGLLELQSEISHIGERQAAASAASKELKREAQQAKGDLEAMHALGAADGVPLSQKLVAGNQQAKALLEQEGYRVSDAGAVQAADGHRLTPQEVDDIGRQLLQEAAADYQQRKATYQTMRTQLEDQLDMNSRLSLNMLEASMIRLEQQVRPANAREAAVDAFTLMVAHGEDIGGIDAGWLERVSREGVDEASLTPAQRAFVDRLASRGDYVRREGSRIHLVGLTGADIGAIRGVHQVLTAPGNDAARQLRDSFVAMVRAWARAAAVAQATGLRLQDALASRVPERSEEPPEPETTGEPGDADGVQPWGAVTTAPLADQPDDVPAQGLPVTMGQPAANPTAVYLQALRERQHDDSERQDQARTDDQRQAALDHQTRRRLEAEAATRDQHAERAADDSRRP